MKTKHHPAASKAHLANESDAGRSIRDGCIGEFHMHRVLNRLGRGVSRKNRPWRGRDEP